jgi:hypothetical protein
VFNSWLAFEGEPKKENDRERRQWALWSLGDFFALVAGL